ncbi:MAG: hypothetical protein ABI358_13925 [Ginsengibacter sp.]
MANPNEYLVFEADQVLTNDSLNQMFYYLDQQNRWTRNKLIGIGIVCGLEIVLNPGVIEITKGVGVTSQGYLIIIPDPKSCTYYTPYSPIDTPNDLPFTYPGDLPFYKSFCAGKNIYLLLTDVEYDALETDQQNMAQTISSATDKFFNDYVVVLFLEANEMDLKNCDAFDCNNKGEKMMLQVRPLLVKKTDLPGKPNGNNDNENTTNIIAPIAALKRFNVPSQSLQSSDDIINAFVNLVDDGTLSAVANAYNYCYQNYSSLLNNPSDFKTLLNDLKNFRNIILQKNPLFIQYFYDFIDDLIKAYKEFVFKIRGMLSACCPDENLFPLHLVLGEASVNSSALVNDIFRIYFIYSPLFSKQGNGTSETAFLYRRMELLVKEFTILFQASFRQIATRITPSLYEFHWLSERAIPYYYNVNDVGNELYQSWNYYKSSHGIADRNLGYNATMYSDINVIIQPLLYDIERYNFFRIEGHIGQDYTQVLKNILGQRSSFNLPFDVVAIAADQLPADATNLPECNILDLETDYKLILSELACKLHTPFCLVTKFPYPYAQVGTNTAAINTDISSINTLKTEAFQNISSSFATLVIAYQKGDFMRKYCAPNAVTVGSFYLNSLTSAAGFINPIQQVNSKDFTSLLYYHIFNFVDAVESLMQLVMTSSIASLDIIKFQQQYILAKTSASLLAILIAEYYENTITGDTIAPWLKDLEIDLVSEEFTTLIYSCLDERLQTLKAEYNRRLQLYQLQRSFLYYYQKHPGLEHKAGVPKGGTFVLVYHPAPQPAILTGRINALQNADLAAVSGNQLADVSINNDTINLIRSFVDDCNDAPPAKKKTIIDILTFLQTPPPKYQLPGNVVIADFYVPYLCCSDCAPIAYVLKEPDPEPADKPVIKMGTTFCDSDKTQPVTVSPAGGTFANASGNPVKGLDATGPTFTPAAAGAGTYVIIYTVGGVASDPVTVTVLQTPKDSNFSFVSKPQTNLIFTAAFTPEIKDANSYSWTFGPGFNPQVSTAQSPVIQASFSPTGGETITFATLVVSNGNCSAAPLRKELRISPNGVYEPAPIGVSKNVSDKTKAPVKKVVAKSKALKEKKISAKKKSADKKENDK